MASMTKKTARRKLNETRRRRNRRIQFVGFILFICISALFLRIGYITVTYGAEFERRAVRQLIRRQNNVERVIPPAHGGILDRNRQPLVDSDRIYNIALDVTVLHSLEPTRRNPNPQEVILRRLREDLGIPMDTLWQYLATDSYGELLNPGNWRIIARNIPAYIALPLSEVPHVNLEERTRRRYPDPFMAPQVLGFVRGDGIWGLERQFRRELAGEPGRVFRSFQSDSVGFTEEVPPRDGYWLVTTLDSGIQRIAQRAVERYAIELGAEYTGIVIMQPHTGEILAMAQFPSFPLDAPDDGTRFTDPQASQFWRDMEADEQMNHMFRTWRNFFLSTSFEQGSIFKPFVMAAAVEEGIICPDLSHFYCQGVRTVADREIPCMSHHGSLNLRQAMMVSCNIAVIDIIQALGRDNFYRYRNDFGFGDRTGIDLPGEEAVSGPGVMYALNQLNAVQLATSSLGQGFNATAIQAINGFASLINGGYVMRPFVVSQIVDANGNIVEETTPTVVRNVLSRSTSDIIRESMHAVVSPYGTGRRAHIEGFHVGGKTGTGQQGHLRDWVVTSFLGFMPVENPQFLAMAIVFNPENNQLTAGATAAPMLREVFEEIIQYTHMPPAGAEQATGVFVDAGAELLSDFSGMELRYLTPILNNMGLDYEISGRGAVVSHHIPAAGQPVPRNTPIFLYLDGDIENLYDLTFVPNVEGLRAERAEEQMMAAGLVPVIVSSSIIPTPLYDEEEDGEPQEYDLIIYNQFPSPGQHIQRGTLIRLRARPVR